MNPVGTPYWKLLLKHFLFVGVPCLNVMYLTAVVLPKNLGLFFFLFWLVVVVFSVLYTILERRGWQFK